MQVWPSHSSAAAETHEWVYLSSPAVYLSNSAIVCPWSVKDRARVQIIAMVSRFSVMTWCQGVLTVQRACRRYERRSCVGA